MTDHQPRRCTATTAAGPPCRAWAVPGSEPARCAAHGGCGAIPSPPAAAATHDREPAADFYANEPGAVTVDQAIAGLVDKMRRLDHLIAAHEDTNGYLIRLFTLYTQASSRLGRLLRDRRALSGEAVDSIAAAMGRALDELSTEWGVDL